MSRSYGWSSFYAWGLTLSGAVLALGGVVGAYAIDQRGPAVALCIGAAAVLMACAIACTNMAASAAIRAMRRPRVVWAVLLPAAAICAGLGYVAQLGIHLGWDVLKSGGEVAVMPETSLTWALWITAFAKPVMALLIEGMKSIDAEDEIARKAASAAAAARALAPRNDTRELDEARERRDASAGADTGWPPITQERVSAACRALASRDAPLSASAVAREMAVGKDRICRALNANKIQLAA